MYVLGTILQGCACQNLGQILFLRTVEHRLHTPQTQLRGGRKNRSASLLLQPAGCVSQDVSSQSKSFHFFLNGESDQSESCIFLILLLLPLGFESSASTAVLPTTQPASRHNLDGTGGRNVGERERRLEKDQKFSKQTLQLLLLRLAKAEFLLSYLVNLCKKLYTHILNIIQPARRGSVGRTTGWGSEGPGFKSRG